MTEHLLQLDRQLFHFINYTLANPVLDAVMPWLRNPKFWVPLYLFIILFSIIRYKKSGVVMIILLLMTVGIADYGSATLLKSFFKRVRPCNDTALKGIEISRVDCGTGYSFPSTHASDHFSIAIFLCLVYRRRWIWFWAILWAALICFAQVYVGVHYPIDVTAGALFGSLVGAGSAWIFKRVQPQFFA